MRRRLRYAPAGTRRTKPAPLATEGHQEILLAGVTTETEKPVGQNATPQVVVKLALDIGRQAQGIGVVIARGEESLQVLRDHGVEHRLAGIPGCVGGNRWRYNSPHGQQGEKGSARNCPQLYCSFVQYTSKMLPQDVGETRSMRRLASARVSRCPSGGGKIAFVFPIRIRRMEQDRHASVEIRVNAAAFEARCDGWGGACMVPINRVSRWPLHKRCWPIVANIRWSESWTPQGTSAIALAHVRAARRPCHRAHSLVVNRLASLDTVGICRPPSVGG